MGPASESAAQLSLPGVRLEPGPAAARRPWQFVAAGARDLLCLRAAERREQLQLAYRTWVAGGRRQYGDSFNRLTWAAEAHRDACMCAGL